MKRVMSKVLAILILVAFMSVVGLFLHTKYSQEKQQGLITQISLEMQEVQKKYAEDKLSDARDQMRTLQELFAMQQNLYVRIAILPTYAQLNSVLGFQSEAANALAECERLVNSLEFTSLDKACQYCYIANAAYQSENPALAAKMLTEAENLLPTIASVEEKGLLSFRIADTAALLRNVPKVEEYQAKMESFIKLSQDAKWKTEMAQRVQILKEMRVDLQTEANAKDAEKNMSIQEKLDRN